MRSNPVLFEEELANVWVLIGSRVKQFVTLATDFIRHYDSDDRRKVKEKLVRLKDSFEALDRPGNTPLSAATKQETRLSALRSALSDIESYLSGQNLHFLTARLVHALKKSAPVVGTGSTKSRFSRRVFVVHGHDDEMKNGVSLFLKRLKFEPVILHHQPNKGRTLIEKFTDYSDVGFAVVLLSPDDVGRSKADKKNRPKPRARQNVVLELGYFLGKLGRERVVALHKGANDFEMPTDLAGVLYVTFDKSGSWQSDLVKELEACGYDVSASKLLRSRQK